jgi:two-component system KDP operon response regulator KdpE
MSRRILVVEDDPEFAGLLALWLERAGASPRIAATGTEAMRAVYDDRPDLVTLDVGLPHLDGWQLCARIREASTVPIMIVSARGSETDRIRGLQLGADDYITKPFSFREFVARVEAVLRRAAMPPARGGPEVVRHGGLLIDIGGHRVVVGDHEVHLTPIEFRVLASLARKQGALVSHGQLLHDAWGPEYRDELPLLRTAIRGLRTKLANASGERGYIGTEYGLGYRLAPAGVDVAG